MWEGESRTFLQHKERFLAPLFCCIKNFSTSFGTNDATLTFSIVNFRQYKIMWLSVNLWVNTSNRYFTTKITKAELIKLKSLLVSLVRFVVETA